MSERQLSNYAGSRGPAESGGLGLLDFLFTVAIGLGLTPELLSTEHLRGVLSQEWVKQGLAPGPPDWFKLCTLGLGLMTTVFSWFGYHRSIAHKPLTYETLRGMTRFTIDVVLILLYGLMMIFFGSFVFVVLVLTVVFWLYVTWDLIRAWEYWGSYVGESKLFGLPRYELIPIPWAVVASVTLMGINVWPSDEPWLALGAAALAVFGFRFHKRWERRGTEGLGHASAG